MDFTDFMGARQLLAEERVGTRVREAEDAEDRRIRASTEAIRRDNGNR